MYTEKCFSVAIQNVNAFIIQLDFSGKLDITSK